MDWIAEGREGRVKSVFLQWIAVFAGINEGKFLRSLPKHTSYPVRSAVHWG